MTDINLTPDSIKKSIFFSNIKSYINDFKNNNLKENFKEYENESLENILKYDEEKIIEIFSSAVSLAYDDAKRRFAGIGEVWNPNIKTDFFKYIAKMIYNIFQNHENDFDKQHEHICIYLNNKLKESGYNDISYGKAQKIINMTFKYLYCLNTNNIYEEEIFQKCHMPLDSFTLEWCRRYLKDKPTTLKSDTSWSGMEYELYKSLQEKIKEQLSYPLYAEFIIWPEMQKHIAAENFIFSFKSYTKEEKISLKKKELSTKFNEIIKILESQKRSTNANTEQRNL